MNKLFIQNLTVNDLDLLDKEYLVSSLVVDKLIELVEDPIYDSESGKAQEFYIRLDSLVKTNLDLLKADRELYKKYQVMLLKLYWMSFSSQKPEARRKALSHNLIFSLRYNIDVLYNLAKVLDTYEYGMGVDQEERQKFLYALGNNEERLGNQPLVLKTKEKAPPTIKNWLKDVSAQVISAGGSRFNMINYFNSSQNVQKLTQPEREILKQIIELYAWLLTPQLVQVVKDADYVPEGKTIPQAPSKPQPILNKASIPKTHPIVVESKIEKKETRGESLERLRSRIETAPKDLNDSEILSPKRSYQDIGISHLPNPKSQNVSEPSRLSQTLQSKITIKVVDDLKNLGVGFLKQDNLIIQIDKIKAAVLHLANVNRMYIFQVVKIFEQSPLFKAYLAQGNAKVTRQEASNILTHAEFEAIADLNKELERL